MVKRRLLAIALMIVLLLSGCSNAADTVNTEAEESTVLSKDVMYRVLFIGNSYTFYNDMPTNYFQIMARACGYQVEVSSITKGAYTLEKFADPGDPYGSMVDKALSVEGAYDYVILQEQSVRPVSDANAFYDGVRALTERIRKIGAKPVLYATWGRQTGSDKLKEIQMTSEEMSWHLAAAYSAIGEELNIPVFHAGLAFLDINTNTDIDLYNADLSHPSSVGSYLAAMTLFSGIFGVDPVTAPFSGVVSGEADTALRKAAAKVVFDCPEIPNA